MLPPYFESPGKRLVKSPKLYWIDPGLWRYQTGYWGEASGTLLEGYDEDAITFPQYYRVTVGPPGDPTLVRQAFDTIRKAHRPLLVVGSGVW